MKGISAVIAVVLILMITVALAAMAYVWFTDVFGTITEGAGAAADTTATTIATSFSISGASTSTDGKNVTVVIANTGSANITAGNLVLWVNNTLIDDHGATGSIGPGETKILSEESGIDGKFACGQPVKITYGSLQQVTTIAC